MKANIEFTLDGKEYHVEPYLTTRGFLLLKNLTALLGNPLIKLVGSLPKGKSVADLKNLTNEDIDLNAIAGIFSTALSSLDDATAEKLMRDILARTFYKGSPVVDQFDSHFQGDYWHLLKLTKRTLEAQYGDFLAVITGGALKQTPVKKV